MFAACKCQKHFKRCGSSSKSPRVRYDHKTGQVNLEVGDDGGDGE